MADVASRATHFETAMPTAEQPWRPPWVNGRPRRSGAARRPQALRAEGRTCQRMIKAFAELHSHRGGMPTQLGAALAETLKQSEVKPRRPEMKAATTQTEEGVDSETPTPEERPLVEEAAPAAELLRESELSIHLLEPLPREADEVPKSQADTPLNLK